MKTESSWNSSSKVNLPDSTPDSQKGRISQFIAHVAENRPISASTYRLDLALPSLDSLRVYPGEFFMIRISPGLDPLLRRPFSLHSIGSFKSKRQQRLSILFRTVGRGTHLMAAWTRGKPVDMIGPLGRGYTVPEGLRTGIMIAGGLGIASLFALAESIVLKGKATHVRAYLGGKSKPDVLLKKELEDMGATVNVTTEDGSLGTRGLITRLLEREGPQLAKDSETMVYACGPLEMLAKVAAITQELSIPCQVSLEARMACGVGSCLSCVVRTRDEGYQLVCKNGPVFDASRIDWKNTERLL